MIRPRRRRIKHPYATGTSRNASLRGRDTHGLLLGAVMLGLHFSTVAMFALACLVLVAAIQSLRTAVTPRLPLSIIAATYVGFGIAAFVLSGSHHTLGYVLIGVLIFGAIAIPEPR